MHGVNVDPSNPLGAPTPAELKASGFTWVRLVSRKSADSYVNDMRASGIKVLAVVARESDYYVSPNATLYQIGNEPDLHSESSWTLSPHDYLDLWDWFHSAHPGLPSIVAGQASGSYGWWEEVRHYVPEAKGFAVHPYAKTAIEALPLLTALKLMSPDLPLYVTEWNRPLAEVAAFQWLLDKESIASFWFAWSDGMVPGFGLTNPHKSLFASLANKEVSMALDVSKELVAKLKALGDFPILDSSWRHNKDGTSAEVTQGTKGIYISSEADGWQVRGPFPSVL